MCLQHKKDKRYNNVVKGHIESKMGPRIKPCGTPYINGADDHSHIALIRVIQH